MLRRKYFIHAIVNAVRSIRKLFIIYRTKIWYCSAILIISKIFQFFYSILNYWTKSYTKRIIKKCIYKKPEINSITHHRKITTSQNRNKCDLHNDHEIMQLKLQNLHKTQINTHHYSISINKKKFISIQIQGKKMLGEHFHAANTLVSPENLHTQTVTWIKKKKYFFLIQFSINFILYNLNYNKHIKY